MYVYGKQEFKKRVFNAIPWRKKICASKFANFCELGAHAKYQNPRVKSKGRRKNIVNSGQYVPPSTPYGSACSALQTNLQ